PEPHNFSDVMELKRQLLFCCISLLQLLHCRSEHSSIGFATVALCPDISALPSRHAKSKMLCGTACSANMDCDLFHFTRTTGLCYLGNSTCEGLRLWTNGPCVSYKSVRPRVRASAEPIAEQLSLKMLYRFGTHGLENAADPSKYRLWSGSATTIDAQGAHFVTKLTSYLMAATPCFESVVNKGNKFSFFVRAKHPMDIDGTYVAFRQCSGNNVAHDFFYTYNRNYWHQVFWPADGKYYLSKSGNVFSKSSSVALVSTGLTYDADRNVNFFFNGSMYSATLDSSKSASNLNDANFQCMQLGGFPGDAQYSVQGSMSCFALSTRLLTQAEFVQLDNWCKQV
uniref:Fibrinogen C-terminal domain-containing protein n=1 Tax=Macrostomum lignano TaxID=282301 RepID=A0A1I8IBL1_9PLAT